MRRILAPLAAAALSLTGAAVAAQPAVLYAIPLDRKAHLLIGGDDFERSGTQKSGSLTSYHYLHKREPIHLWVHVERVKGPANADGCKEQMNVKLQAGRILGSADDSIGSRGDAITAFSLLPITAGVSQGHAFTCRTHGNQYVVIQVAKMYYQEADREMLFRLAEQITLVDPEGTGDTGIF